MSVPDAPEIVQLKVWLHGISPMVWRRLLVPGACTLRELHGVLQVAMGWEGIHLYQFLPVLPARPAPGLVGAVRLVA